MENNERLPLRITVNRFGGRAHQIGNGPQSEAGRGSGSHSSWEGVDMPTGEVVVHVRDGKPVTALGRKILGLASPALVAAREGSGFDMEGLCTANKKE